MRRETKPSFTGEVRRMLRRHSILPFALALLQAVLILSTIFYFGIWRGAQQRRDYAATQLDAIVRTYRSYAQTHRADEAHLALLRGSAQDRQAVQTLYAFVNSQEVRANFYLFDVRGQCLLGSVTELTGYLQATPPYTSGIFYRMNQQPGEVILMLNNAGAARRRSMVLTIGTAVCDGQELLGYLIFELDPAELLEAISSPGMGDLVVTNAYGTALLTSKNSYLDEYSKLSSALRITQGFAELDGAQIFVTHCQISEPELEVYALLEINAFYKALILTAVLGMVLLAGMLLANHLLARRVATAEAGSVDRLISDLEKMQKEGIYVPLESGGGAFPTLEESYHRLLEQTRSLVEANRQEAVMRKTAEIKQLESQVNPHFIFNTLEVIRCLIKLDPTAANRMILDFSALLRYSIDNSREVVTLRDDLTYIRSYLSIMQMRLSHRLEYELRVAEGLEMCMVPKLCLQPIVENAVKYAASARKTLHLLIDISCKGGDIVMRICDDGAGIEPQRLEQIRRELKKPEPSGSFFGLYNIHRRLSLMYGERYGLTIESTLGEGTAVELHLPRREEER